jgi:hypothetical protein
MGVPEEPVCIDLFRQNPVFTSLHLKSPVHIVSLESNKPFVLMDQLIALKPDSLDDVIKALFFQRMPGYILDVANPKDYIQGAVPPHAAMQQGMGTQGARPIL